MTRSGGRARFDLPRPTTLCGRGCASACGTHCPVASSTCVAVGADPEAEAARFVAAMAAVSMYRFRSRSRNSKTSESDSSPWITSSSLQRMQHLSIPGAFGRAFCCLRRRLRHWTGRRGALRDGRAERSHPPQDCPFRGDSNVLDDALCSGMSTLSELHEDAHFAERGRRHALVLLLEPDLFQRDDLSRLKLRWIGRSRMTVSVLRRELCFGRDRSRAASLARPSFPRLRRQRRVVSRD